MEKVDFIYVTSPFLWGRTGCALYELQCLGTGSNWHLQLEAGVDMLSELGLCSQEIHSVVE